MEHVKNKQLEEREGFHWLIKLNWFIKFNQPMKTSPEIIKKLVEHISTIPHSHSRMVTNH